MTFWVIRTTRRYTGRACNPGSGIPGFRAKKRGCRTQRQPHRVTPENYYGVTPVGTFTSTGYKLNKDQQDTCDQNAFCCFHGFGFFGTLFFDDLLFV